MVTFSTPNMQPLTRASSTSSSSSPSPLSDQDFDRRPSLAPSLALTLVNQDQGASQTATAVPSRVTSADPSVQRGPTSTSSPVRGYRFGASSDCGNDVDLGEQDITRSTTPDSDDLSSQDPERRGSSATDNTLFTPASPSPVKGGWSKTFGFTPLKKGHTVDDNDGDQHEKGQQEWNETMKTARSSTTRVDSIFHLGDGTPKEKGQAIKVTDVEKTACSSEIEDAATKPTLHQDLKVDNKDLYEILEQEGLTLDSIRTDESPTRFVLIACPPDHLPDTTISNPSPPAHPMPKTFSTAKKTVIVCLASWITILVCMCASGFSTGAHVIKDEFGLVELEGMEREDGYSGEWVWGTFGGLGLYLLGFATGPMLLAPASEVWGRRPVYLISWVLFCLCQIPIALAHKFPIIAVFRFLSGFVGSAPLSNVAGTITDLVTTAQSGYAIALYALASVIGPALGSVTGGYPVEKLGWRWLFWIYAIVFGAHLIVIWLLMPETREDIILKQKAAHLRNTYPSLASNCYASSEMTSKSGGQLLKASLTRPYVFLFTEPITYLSGAVNAFALGMIFLSNEAFPLIFGRGNSGHRWTSYGAINLTFLSYVVGSLLAFACQPLQQRAYLRSIALSHNSTAPPEIRWWFSRFAVPLLPLGLQLASWTSDREIFWFVPLIGFAMFGFAFFSVIVSIFAYMMDSYKSFSASAMSGVVLSRNLVCAFLPLAARPMFKTLGNQWALFTLSLLSCLLVPIPWFLYYKGKTIRQKSPFCRQHMED